MVDKMTQTTIKRNKNKIRESSNSRSLAKHYNNEDIKETEIADNTANESVRKTVDENFLRNLQMKNDILINDFFDRQSSKLSHTSEFKQQAKLKRYALPILNTKPKSFHSSVVSQDALKKINVLRTFTDTCLSSEEKRKDEKAVESIQANWQYRYFLGKNESNRGDSSKQNRPKTMLEYKPKSLLVLSMMKSDTGKGKILDTTMKTAEMAKQHENDTTDNRLLNS